MFTVTPQMKRKRNENVSFHCYSNGDLLITNQIIFSKKESSQLTENKELLKLVKATKKPDDHS